ncbi:MAG: universal stress protein [Acidiferrobacterales bacterium]|nr:universal stress protein [Acidiferrobacterales bacterium]
MKENILVALDGSECGERALAAATKHAQITDSRLFLTYVIDWSPYTFNTPEENEQRHQRRESEIQKASETIVNPKAQELKDAGLDTETVVRHGKIAETLVNLTSELDIDQIFIGKIGESRLQTMIFGSVTAALVQTSSVPVTVVP